MGTQCAQLLILLFDPGFIFLKDIPNMFSRTWKATIKFLGLIPSLYLSFCQIFSHFKTDPIVSFLYEHVSPIDYILQG